MATRGRRTGYKRSSPDSIGALTTGSGFRKGVLQLLYKNRRHALAWGLTTVRSVGHGTYKLVLAPFRLER
jgi:hypothetical protein